MEPVFPRILLSWGSLHSQDKLSEDTLRKQLVTLCALAEISAGCQGPVGSTHRLFQPRRAVQQLFPLKIAVVPFTWKLQGFTLRPSWYARHRWAVSGFAWRKAEGGWRIWKGTFKPGFCQAREALACPWFVLIKFQDDTIIRLLK